MKKITFTDQEGQALLQLLDAGVRHLGLNGVDATAFWKQKIQSAEEENDGQSTDES